MIFIKIIYFLYFVAFQNFARAFKSNSMVSERVIADHATVINAKSKIDLLRIDKI